MINNLAKVLHKNESPKPATVTVMGNDIRSRLPSAADDTNVTSDDVIMSTIPSKQVFGIGIIAIGLLILSIAFIMGFQFPKYVFDKTIDYLCILSPTHPEYGVWVNDSYRTHFNRVFYWNLTNPDVVRAGGQPQFREAGPYIYRQLNNRYNVVFVDATVMYYDTTVQVFEKELTQMECKSCSAYDVITTYNTFYLKTIGKCGGLKQYLIWKLPTVLNGLLTLLTKTVGANTVYRELGTLNRSLIDQQYSSTYPADFHYCGYGRWLMSSSSPYRDIVLGNFLQGQDSFSVVQMRGLYDALTSPHRCDAVLLTSNVTSHCNNLPFTSSNDSDILCTFYDCLLSYDHRNSNGLQNDPVCLHHYLCQDKNHSCIDLSVVDDMTRQAFVSSLHDYMSYMMTYVHHVTVELSDNDLITIRSQDDLARGYVHKEFLTDEVLNVPGVLPHVNWNEPVRHQAPSVTLSNCYEKVDAASNFHWRAYNGFRTLPIEYFPLASPAERQVGSPYLNLAPYSKLAACAFYGTQLLHLDMFIPAFLRRLPFYAHTNTTFNGITVERFYLNKSALSTDNSFVFREGLQDMQGPSHYCSWISLPHFLYADKTRETYYQFLMKPKTSLHTSFLDVQAITGEVWQRTIRYQLNVGVPSSYVTLTPSVAQCLQDLTPIPVYWVDATFSFNDDGLRHYNYHVRRLLNASCGGLISVAIMGALVIILGILSSTVRIRSGRIVPIKDDAFD